MARWGEHARELNDTTPSISERFADVLLEVLPGASVSSATLYEGHLGHRWGADVGVQAVVAVNVWVEG